MVTTRRGGTLTDDDHQLLALWAAECAEHVLGYFEREQPDDLRPRDAIAAARAWAHGVMPMMQARAIGGHAMGAARFLATAARFAACSAGQAACVGHVAEHDLGAAAYAIKAARSARPDPDAGRIERDWQRDQLAEPICFITTVMSSTQLLPSGSKPAPAMTVGDREVGSATRSAVGRRRERVPARRTAHHRWWTREETTMRVLEWLKGLLRPKGKLGGPAGGPHPGPFPTKKD